MVFRRCRGKQSELSSEALKASILQIARSQFAQFGFQGTNLKDIAKQAGVASSLINYHFSDKETLFKVCTEQFARSRMNFINRLLGEPRSQEELRIRLELFVEEMMASALEDPCSFEILDREMQAGNPMILKLFQETLLVAFQNVVQFFQQAKNNGLLKSEVDPVIVAILLFSAACDTVRKDHLVRKFLNVSFAEIEWRRDFAGQVVRLFLNGVVK